MTALSERIAAVAGGEIVEQVLEALETVLDPGLHLPITELGLIGSITLTDAGVEVGLRPSTGCYSPDFAYLMAFDAVDALNDLPGPGRVTVYLDTHRDGEQPDAGSAVGHRAAFGGEAEDGLDELRVTIQRKAHTLAMERCLTELINSGAVSADQVGNVLLRDLPAGPDRAELLRRRAYIGLSLCRNGLVMVDDFGKGVPADEVPAQLRRARSVRDAMAGNARTVRQSLSTRTVDDQVDRLREPIISDLRTRH